MFKGMVSDVLPVHQPEGTYRYAANKYIDISGNVGDEPGTTQLGNIYDIILATAFSPCGNTVLLAYHGERFIIAILEEGFSVREILNTEYYQPDIEKPFKAEVTYNDTKQRILVWTGDAEPYLLNLDDNDSIINQTTKELVDPSYLGLVKLFREFKVPVFESAQEVHSQGSLRSGAYSFSIAYENEDGSILDYCSVSNQVNVSDNEERSPYHKYDGCPPGTPTTRSISLEVSNLDQRYKRLRLAVIKRIGGVISAVEIGSLDITGPTMTLLYLGSEIEKDILLEEILIPSLKYDRVRTLTLTDQYLALANFSTDEIYNYQLYANKIKSKWVQNKRVSLNRPLGSHRDGGFTFYDKSFMPGEVYAFYINWVLKDGRRTPKFHIPGRPVESRKIHNTVAWENTKLKDIDEEYFSQDLILSEDIKYYHTRDTAGKHGKMGFWENEETYPSDFPEGDNGEVLAGNPVRHHKFPSTRELFEFGYLSGDEADDHKGDHIGNVSNDQFYFLNTNTFYIRSSFQGDVPELDEYMNFPEGVFIKNCVIDYSVNLDFIVHHFIQGSTSLKFSFEVFSNGNWSILEEGNLTLHSEYQNPDDDTDPDNGTEFHRLQLNAVGTYLILAEDTNSRFRLRILYSNTNEEVNQCGIDPSQGFYTADFNCDVFEAIGDLSDFISSGLGGRCLGIQFDEIEVPLPIRGLVQGFEIHYAKRQINTSRVVFQSIPYGASISAPQGVPINGIYPSIDLLANDVMPSTGVTFLRPEVLIRNESGVGWSTSAMYYPVDPDYHVMAAREVEYLPYNYENQRPQNLSIRTYQGYYEPDRYVLVSACSFKKNMHSDFNNRETVHTGRFYPVSTEDIMPQSYSTGEIYSGDTFIDISGFRLYSEEGDARGMRILAHTAYPVGLRHDGDRTWETYFPKHLYFPSEWYSEDVSEKSYNNFVFLNTDYAQLNTFLQLPGNTKRIRENVNFPNDICFTHIKGKELSDYMKFLPRNYYELSRIRGSITNMEWNGRNLLINTESSLFRTITQRAMKADEEDIILGSADLFAIPPEEVITSKEQYAGCQHISGCLMTKQGYFFVDGRKGKIFLLTDTLNEISNFGNQKFIESKFRLYELDHYNHRYHLAYDDELNRVLFNLFNAVKQEYMTMSFSTLSNMWVGIHDYLPTTLFSDRFGLFGKLAHHAFLYKFNNWESPRKFGNDTYPSVMDIPYTMGFNPFITSNISWDSWAMHINKAKLEDVTFNKLVVYNSHQCSFEIELEPKYLRKRYWFNKFWDILLNENLPFIDDNFNLIPEQADNNKPWDKKKRFIDDHVVIRLISDAHPDVFVYLTELNVHSRPFKIV